MGRAVVLGTREDQLAAAARLMARLLKSRATFTAADFAEVPEAVDRVWPFAPTFWRWVARAAAREAA